MDPLTAIGLASNILSFIDFATKVVAGAVTIHGSASGLTKENQTSRAIATQMRSLSSVLQQARDTQPTGEEKALYALAAECHDLSGNIIDLVEKTKPKHSKSKTSSFRAAIKLRWYETDRRRLEEQLHHCRSQLSIHLDYLSSSEVLKRLEALVASSKNDASALDRLSGRLNDIRVIAIPESLSLETRSQIDSLVSVSDHVADMIGQQWILKSLAFSDMRARYGAVADAHEQTFRWIFDSKIDDRNNRGHRNDKDDKGDKDDLVKAAARDALHSWLSAGTGIFHISGKLGSGKSTLMKYLCGHPSTKALLNEWAGDRELVSASFFFWKPGSILQNSLTGLLRSLIHDVLRSYPQLIKQIFPEKWSHIRSTPWQATGEIQFQDKEIRQAFSRLVSNPELYGDRSFCFFIDGLDEYKGTIQDDPRYFVDQLRSWTTSAPDHIKLCVSSREDNVFMNAFQESKRIRLHQLTLSDIRLYVHDKLRCLNTEQDKKGIVRHVVDNAQGIFLWAALAAKRIREQIENGTSTADIMHDIDALPCELEDLFTHLLNSLPDSDLRKAYQTFLILQCTEGPFAGGFESCHFTLLAFSFLDDYNRDSLFATREEFNCDPLEITSRLNVAKRRLNGYCRGLVDIVYETGDHGAVDVVEFTHRSVPEFLSSLDRKSRVPSSLANFDAVDAFSQLKLAEFSAYPRLFENHAIYPDPFPALIASRMERNLDIPPYQFLEALSKAVSKNSSFTLDAFSWPTVERLIEDDFDDSVGPNPAIRSPYRANVAMTIGWRSREKPGRRTNYCVQLPILYTTLLGSFGYIRWRLQHYDQQTGTIDPINLQLLLRCTIGGVMKDFASSNFDAKDLADTVDLLIRSGLAPQKLTGMFFSEFKVYERTLHSSGYQRKYQMTLWHLLLVECYNFSLWNHFGTFAKKVGYILERYLEYGADPHCVFTAKNLDTSMTKKHDNNEEKDGIFIRALKLSVGQERRELLVEFRFSRNLQTDCPVFENKSLVEYLEVFKDGFENWERILQLVDRNLKGFGGTIGRDTGST